jgi:alpha-D-ribose 1-methylphosphonate 5-triphosphate synthase subunit PhnH
MSRLDPSGAVQFDAKHPTRSLTITVEVCGPLFAGTNLTRKGPGAAYQSAFRFRFPHLLPHRGPASVITEDPAFGGKA